MRHAKKEDEMEEILKNGTAIETLVDQANEIKENSIDYIVPQREHSTTRFKVDCSRPELLFKPEKGKKLDMGMSEFAFRSLCTNGVPAAYIDKCMMNNRANLAEKNMNSWLKDYTSPLFVRTSYGHVRGVLTTKYSAYDADRMMADVQDIMGDIEDRYEIKQSLLNEERLHLRFVAKDPLDVEGEDLFPGFTIDSSDVGRSCLEVNAIIWKKVCTNGLMLPKKFEALLLQRHMGIEFPDLRKEFLDSIDKIEPLIAKMEESVIETAKKPLVLQFDNSAEQAASEQKLHRELGLMLPEARRVLEILKTDTYPENRWGLINAITEAAQTYTLERRIELERAAGKLLV